jgi:hypothetical protein
MASLFSNGCANWTSNPFKGTRLFCIKDRTAEALYLRYSIVNKCEYKILILACGIRFLPRHLNMLSNYVTLSISWEEPDIEPVGVMNSSLFEAGFAMNIKPQHFFATEEELAQQHPLNL